MEPLLPHPIGFGHRGARGYAPENTIEAFRLALKLGASGLESDAWVTADGAVVLDHDGVVKSGLRRRGIAEVRRRQLPGHIPTLADLYDACGTDFELSLDIKDVAAAPGVLAAARNAGGDAIGRLWMCHHDWQQVEQWRALDADVRLVDSTRLKRMKDGPERRAAQLGEAGIDAVNMHHSDWTGGLVTLFHRFERLAFGWDCQFPRVLDALLAMGIDALYSDFPDRMMESLARNSA